MEVFSPFCPKPGHCGSPAQRHEAAVVSVWCEQSFPLPAQQAASGWPRAAPGQPVVCCTSPVHSQVLTALPQPPGQPGQLSLHVPLTVPLPRQPGVAPAREGQGGCWGCWPSSALSLGAASPASPPGLPGEGGYDSLSSAGVWGREASSPGPIQTLLHTLITDRDKALSNLSLCLKDNEERRGKIISSGE